MFKIDDDSFIPLLIQAVIVLFNIFLIIIIIRWIRKRLKKSKIS
jgi:hypothetical protein